MKLLMLLNACDNALSFSTLKRVLGNEAPAVRTGVVHDLREFQYPKAGLGE